MAKKTTVTNIEVTFEDDSKIVCKNLVEAQEAVWDMFEMTKADPIIPKEIVRREARGCILIGRHSDKKFKCKWTMNNGRVAEVELV